MRLNGIPIRPSSPIHPHHGVTFHSLRFAIARGHAPPNIKVPGHILLEVVSLLCLVEALCHVLPVDNLPDLLEVLCGFGV